MTTAEQRDPGSPDGPGGTAGALTARDPRAVRAAPVPGSSIEGMNRSWAREVVWWDATFYLVVVLNGIGLVVAGVRGTDLTVSLTALGVIVLAYTLVGRVAARTRDQRRAVTYLVVLVAATLVVVAHDTLGTLLLFVAFTQIWMLSERLVVSVAFCVVLATGTALALAWESTGVGGTGGVVPRRIDTATFLAVLPQMGIALAFALGLGLWVAYTMRQSEQRALLVDELRATQAELARSHHEAGVTAERERLAQEIHDTLAQGFTSIVMLAQAADADLGRDATVQARERLALVEETARENLAEARALVSAFAPLALQGSTLAEALARLGGRFAEETGLEVDVAVDAVPGLRSADEVVLLRSAQESLANVRRHADAHRVSLRMGVRDDVVHLDVVDDGRGLGDDFTEGYGLRGMRERVRAGGGEVSVTSVPDGGTAVRVRLPSPVLLSPEPSADHEVGRSSSEKETS